ncbi:MAG: exonuclease SbcCD subunit D [Motiliproteus sp.]|nr:exonuclease SbcCD subunit D [Motiliproteus sp.]MCW9052762.1 exonuclease SbcCD subunit D [Motiliproteus sp.]
MRLLHTSDWHIGRQFHNLSLLEDQRWVLQQMLALIAEHRPDAVLIAGDIYDRSVPPAAAVQLLDQVLSEICNQLAIPVIVISGNHDSGERLSFASQSLRQSGLHMVGQLEEMLNPIPLADQNSESGVLVYGIPYADPARVRDSFGADVSSHDQAMAYLCQQIHQHHQESQYAQWPVIVLSHCFVDGCESSESERPLSMGGADRVSAQHFNDFSYSALGHLHGRQYRGQPSICYSGSILKYSFSEQHHHKSVNLVEIDNQGDCQIQQLELKPRRDMRVLEGELQALLAAAENDSNREDYLLIRLTDKHAILDAMGKLRSAYPNVLHLERPGLHTEGEVRLQGREQLKKGELTMFNDFFQQVTGDEMDSQQCLMVSQLLESLHRSDDAP